VGAVVRWRSPHDDVYVEVMRSLSGKSLVVFDQAIIDRLESCRWVSVPVVVSVWRRVRDGELAINLHHLGGASLREAAERCLERAAQAAASVPSLVTSRSGA